MTVNLDNFAIKVDLPYESDKVVDAAYDLALDPDRFEPFTEAWDRFLQTALDQDLEHSVLRDSVQRHFHRAFRVIEKMGRPMAETRPLCDLLETRTVPAIALDSDRVVVGMNIAAKKLFKSIENAHALGSLVHSASVEPLNSALAELHTMESTMPVFVLLQDHTPALFVINKSSTEDAIIIDIVGSSWGPDVDRLLKQNYAMSSKEREVVSFLYQGMAAKSIAAKRHRSEATVRKQIRSVLAKTDCHTQAQLMRLITGMTFAGARQQPAPWFEPDTEIKGFELQDGRSLRFYDTGGVSRPVIVVCHGILHTPELPAEFLKVLLKNGYRVIGVCRAGFGHSTASHDPANLLRESATDLRQLLNHLRIKTVTLLGNMSGSHYCYAAATLMPQRVRNIICIAGTLPYLSQDQIRQMPSGARAMANTARYFPTLSPLLVRSAMSIIDGGDVRRLVKTAYGNSLADLEVLNHPDILRRLSNGYRFAVHQGFASYAQGSRIVMQDHRDAFDKLTCPIHLIHGDDDGLIDIQAVHQLALNRSNVTVSTVKHSGQLALYTKPLKCAIRLLETISHHS